MFYFFVDCSHFSHYEGKSVHLLDNLHINCISSVLIYFYYLVHRIPSKYRNSVNYYIFCDKYYIITLIKTVYKKTYPYINIQTHTLLKTHVH